MGFEVLEAEYVPSIAAEPSEGRNQENGHHPLLMRNPAEQPYAGVQGEKQLWLYALNCYVYY